MADKEPESRGFAILVGIIVIAALAWMLYQPFRLQEECEARGGVYIYYGAECVAPAPSP